MTEAETTTAPGTAEPPHAEAALLAALASLRDAGAGQRDPVRFRYAEALARRMPAAPAAVRRVLHGRLQQAVADCAAALAAPQPAAGRQHGAAEAGPRAGQGPAASLGDLNRYIEAAAGGAVSNAADGAPTGAGDAAPELKSVRRFREAWSRISAEDAVEQAVGRGPENAGPLNSHMLVLRTLTLARALSPDYLRRFLSQADTLLWLESARGRLVRPAGGATPARRGRGRK